MKYIFSVSGIVPISLNKIYAGVHWDQRSKWKNEWRAAFTGWHFWQRPDGTYNAERPVRFESPVEITYLFRMKKPMDSTNLAFMCKLIEDSLSQDQVIEDDTPKYVRSSKFIPVQGKENSVTVIVQTLDEPPMTYEEILALEPE